MINSREIVQLIENKLAFERNSSVVEAFQSLIKDIEVLEDREMRAMYKEYMKEEVLQSKWEELELELTTKR